MKITAFWNNIVSLKQTDVLEVHTASTSKAIFLIMEGVRASETSVYFYETTRRIIAEGGHCIK
jgi:hypothetical protein